MIYQEYLQQKKKFFFNSYSITCYRVFKGQLLKAIKKSFFVN